jgi:undecaprenyl diphosphate synthase
MDGNGRWAKARNLRRSDGHKAGVEAAKAIVIRCREMGIPYLTLYTFSKENWSRPKEEVSFLFDLLIRFLNRELDNLLEQSIRLQILGEAAELPFGVRQVVGRVCEKTKDKNALTLNLALNYSGREEILRACRRLADKKLAPEEITEEAFRNELYTRGQPDPDMIIRTSGELRLSNYLLFQAAYSELYFTDVHWPDFTPDHFEAAIRNYQQRQRRFGKTSDQL